MYHYTESGLKGIWLVDGYEFKDSPYGQTFSISDVRELHKIIGLTLIENKDVLDGDEIRFLRKELNLSQKNLAGLLGVSEESIRSWENSRGVIGTPSDRLLRGYYKEAVTGDGSLRALIENLCHQERLMAKERITLSYESNHKWKTVSTTNIAL